MPVVDTWHRMEKQPDGSKKKVRSAKYGRGNRWAARYRDENNDQKSPTFKTKADAEAHLKRVEGDLQRGQYIDPGEGKVTFSKYFEDWAKRQVWAPNTERAMKLAARSVTFGGVQLRALRRSHLEAWVKAMETADRGEGKPRGLAPGTIKTRFVNVRGVLRAAVRDRVIGTDPSEGVTLPRRRRAEAAMTLPTTDQVRALLESTAPVFTAFVALCAFAGLRLGEAAALRVDDIDFLRRTLKVRRQVQRANGGKVDIRAPKYGSERTVYLPDALLTIIARHVERHCPGDAADRWLFPGESGNPWHQNTVGYYWRTTRTAAGLGALKLHDLRHFYASGLIAQGCDVVTVQRALGHSSASVTLNTYAHLWPSAEDRTRAAAGAMLADTLARASGTGAASAPDVRRG
ncbi:MULTISPECIES: site-specific integrase [unclassified Nocardiopsis]|uniref:tyrosine-type recombinase/integrase n=1 Tax=unclassified Nocardiopsis TaxID=2649073 RepID=UPI001914F715|nr:MULTISPECIES: site-specific integrase [unclassified Nocardiopsis]